LSPSGERLRAPAEAELVALGRGLFLLESAVAIAPLLGLLGTVTGLATLFPTLGQPETAKLAGGFGLALSTTAIGLAIAIPAQLASQAIARRLDVVASRSRLLTEALESLPRP
jgi:biopolymer transport protein ExbB